VSLGASYNVVADSMRLSPIGVSFRTTAGKFALNGGMSFDPYQRVIARASRENQTPVFYRVNQYGLDAGQGLARLSSATLQLTTDISSEDVQKMAEAAALRNRAAGEGGEGGEGDDDDSFDAASVKPIARRGANAGDDKDANAESEKEKRGDDGLRERFRQRMDTSNVRADLFGDNSPGFEPIKLPWALAFSASFSYNEAASPGARPTYSADVSVSGNFTIEKSWRLSARTFYSFLNPTQPTLSLDITKEIHCWDLSFSWQPLGFTPQFNLRFGVRASQLRDIQIRRISDPRFPQ
jgi:hypothetical protein